MNIFTRLVIPFLITITISSSVFAGQIIDKPSWKFVQARGGISVGEPSFRDGEWFLPVDFDVSGTKTVTVAPTKKSKHMICTRTRVNVVQGEIQLTFKLEKTRKKGSYTAQCPNARLGLIVDGTYSVVYVDKKRNKTLLKEKIELKL